MPQLAAACNLAAVRVRLARVPDRIAVQHRNGENVQEAFDMLQEAGKTPEDLYKALTEQRIDLVFTAHPTQAMRGSVRKKYDKLFHDLTRMLNPPSSVSRVEVEADMYADIQVLALLLLRMWPPCHLQVHLVAVILF